MAELTSGWAEHLRQDFRQVALIALMHQPVAWRSRRIDYFESEDLNLALQRTTLDFRFKRRVVGEWLRDLAEGYELAGRSLAGDDMTCLSQASGALDSIDSVDLLVPLFWSPGPTMDLSIDCNGATVAQLSRREAADVIAGGPFIRVMHRAYKAGLVTVPIGIPASSLWSEIGWCLTAADAYCLRDSRYIGGLRGPVHSAGSARRTLAWMRATLREAGCTAGVARVLVRERAGRLRALLTKTEYLRSCLGESDPGDAPFLWCAHNPALNPVLLFHSFVRRVAWVLRDEPCACQPRMGGVLDEFLNVCEYWTDCLDGLIRAVAFPPDPGGASSVACEILKTVSQLGVSWPVLARVDVPVEGTMRVTTSQRIPIPDRSLLDLSEYQPSWLLGCAVFALRLGPFALSELVRTAVDRLSRLVFHRRPPLRSLIGTVGYPLTLHDAASYHVEVACAGEGAALVDRSAFVVIPRKDYGSRCLRRGLGSGLFSTTVGARRLDVHDVFGRVTDSSTSRHHYYTTKMVASWRHRRVIGRAMGATHTGSQPWLLVRYRMSGPWAAALILAACTLLLLGVTGLRLSLLEALDWNQYPGALGFGEFASITTPVFIAIMLLIAVDRRESPVLANRMKVIASVVLAAYVTFGLAVVGWIATEHPRTVWQGAYRQNGVGPVGEYWTKAAGLAQEAFNASESWVVSYGRIAVLAAVSALLGMFIVVGASWLVGIVADWCTDGLGGEQ